MLVINLEELEAITFHQTWGLPSQLQVTVFGQYQFLLL